MWEMITNRKEDSKEPHLFLMMRKRKRSRNKEPQ